MPDFARTAGQILADHQRGYSGLIQSYYCECEDWTSTNPDEFADHLDQVLAAARTISTTSQLNRLPNRSVVRSSTGGTWTKHRIIGSPHHPWWVDGDEVEHPSAAITLPARLLLHPRWAAK